MQTGSNAPTPASLPQAMKYSLVTISSHGRPSIRTQFPAPMLKQNVVLLPKQSPRHPGCVSSLPSCNHLYVAPLWSSVTTSTRSTCHPTQFSISAPSISRLIVTSCGNELLEVMFAYCASQHLHSMPTYSPRVFRRFHLHRVQDQSKRSFHQRSDCRGVLVNFGRLGPAT
jgi:hypothetical protein